MDKFEMPKSAKGHNSGKIWQNFSKVNQVIYSSSPISWPSFKPLAQTLFGISCWQDFILIFSKGHYNSRKGDNSDKKKDGSANFPWGTHAISKPYHAWFVRYGMYQKARCMDGQMPNPKAICPHNHKLVYLTCILRNSIFQQNKS